MELTNYLQFCCFIGKAECFEPSSQLLNIETGVVEIVIFFLAMSGKCKNGNVWKMQKWHCLGRKVFFFQMFPVWSKKTKNAILKGGVYGVGLGYPRG